MTCTLAIPGCRVFGDDMVPLEYQFTILGDAAAWITDMAATATAKIVNADTGATVLDDADTQATGATVTLTDDGRASLDVTDALAALLVAASSTEPRRYWLRYRVTAADNSVYVSPRIEFTVSPDI
jgi:hypothetical protein